MSGSFLAFSLKNTHMSTKSICFSLVTAFAGPFFSIFCHCHTLIRVTLLCRRASACPSACRQHSSPVPAGPVPRLEWSRGLRLLTRGGGHTPGCCSAPLGLDMNHCRSKVLLPVPLHLLVIFCGVRGFLRISLGFFFPIIYLVFLSFHLGERMRLFK